MWEWIILIVIGVFIFMGILCHFLSFDIMEDTMNLFKKCRQELEEMFKILGK